MKTNILFFLTFILCLFKANSAPAPVPVRDVYGKELLAGVKYYVIPPNIDGFSGSILRDLVGNNSCRTGVVKYQVEGYGRPLTITPVNAKKGVIRLSTDVNIKFSGSTTCDESNVWKLKYDKTIKQYSVIVGGVEGNPGPETLDNWFKIEKTTDGYKFVYCPSVCSYCKVMCKDVGTTVGYRGDRLVLGGDPLSFEFYT